MRWVEPIRQSFRSKAAMGMGMGGAITAVAATIMVGTAATTTVGGIIAIGGDFTSSPTSERPPQLAAFSFLECPPLALLDLTLHLSPLRSQKRTSAGRSSLWVHALEYGEPRKHETKYEGYRIQIHIDGAAARGLRENGHDWVKRFSRIAGAFDVPGQAIIDGRSLSSTRGEPIYPNFKANVQEGVRIVCCITPSTLLWLDGQDLRKSRRLKRSLAENQNRPEGEIPCLGFCERSLGSK